MPSDPTDITRLPIGSLQASDVYRPYFTERNAMSLKPKFDEILAGQQGCILQSSTSPSSLHNKLNDGLRWLCEVYGGDRNPYIILRRQVSFRRRSSCVEVVFKGRDSKNMVIANSQIQITAIAKDEMAKSWLQLFTTWCETAKEMDIFDSHSQYGGVIQITPEDELALVKLCATLGCELDIASNKQGFRVAR